MSSNQTSLDHCDSVGIVDIASLSLARLDLSNSSLPNYPVDMVASNKGLHRITLQLTQDSSLVLRTYSLDLIFTKSCSYAQAMLVGVASWVPTFC